MLGTPIASTSAFTYDQQAIPTGTIATGATWRQRDGSNVPTGYQFTWDGNFWRITGGVKSRQRAFWPAATTVTAVTGSMTTAVVSTLGRRVTVASGATGTARNTYNDGATSLAPLGGGASSGTNVLFNFANPIEILLRARVRKTAEGVLRWYLTGTTPSPSADLSTKGIGFSWDLTSSNMTIHVHNGTSLSTQLVAIGSAIGAATTDYIINFELCWNGASLALYVNETYLGVLNQAVSGSETFLLHLLYERPSAIAVAQFIDQYVIQTIGGY